MVIVSNADAKAMRPAISIWVDWLTLTSSAEAIVVCSPATVVVVSRNGDAFECGLNDVKEFLVVGLESGDFILLVLDCRDECGECGFVGGGGVCHLFKEFVYGLVRSCCCRVGAKSGFFGGHFGEVLQGSVLGVVVGFELCPCFVVFGESSPATIAFREDSTFYHCNNTDLDKLGVSVWCAGVFG